MSYKQTKSTREDSIPTFEKNYGARFTKTPKNKQQVKCKECGQLFFSNSKKECVCLDCREW